MMMMVSKSRSKASFEESNEREGGSKAVKMPYSLKSRCLALLLHY